MKMFRKILLLVVALSLLFCFAGCEKTADGEVTKLSFRAASGYDYLKTLDGTTVSINGYMATSSPVDGSFIFLMNLPYQSCPFCIPNTSQLSNTMEIYPQKGEAFSFTNQAIKVVGKLVVAENENEPFTDQYGYQFNFKIVDATYTIIKAEELSEDMALWQKIAQTDVVSEVYRMYDYLNFVCKWNTYYVNPSVDENGEILPGYVLNADDAVALIKTEGAQFNYGYQEGYFDEIIKKIESVDPTAFADLVANVRDAEALAQKALTELENGNYTSEKKYIEDFEREDVVYTLTKGEELSAQMQTLYTAFSNWLGSWEM